MHARFVKLEWENEARTIASLYFKPDRPYYFTAGQYADFTVPHQHADNRGITRTMTLSSLPSDIHLSFITRFFPSGNSSYKNALRALQPGQVVTLTDAMGDMVLPLDSSIPLLFVAGGVGIASYISMVSWLREQRDIRDITILYAVRNLRDVISQKELFEYTKIGSLSEVIYTTDNKQLESTFASISKSRLTSTNIANFLKPTSQIYLSGAQSMVEQLRLDLEKKHRVEHHRIVFDYFDGYSET